MSENIIVGILKNTDWVKRIKCLFVGHHYNAVIRKDLQGGLFYECVKCKKIKT